MKTGEMHTVTSVETLKAHPKYKEFYKRVSDEWVRTPLNKEWPAALQEFLDLHSEFELPK